MLFDLMLRYIKDYENEEFNEKIGILEKEFEESVKNIENDTFKKAQNPSVCKNYNDLLYYLSDSQKEIQKREIEFEKMMEKFLIKWNQQKSTM